jgi:beta-ureidopropionase / N-carbamoyl-L-amino-acid hydrolase
MAAAGAEASLGRSGLLDEVACFVELHVEQGRDLVHREAAVGVASSIRPHGRYRFDFTGQANHAGSTGMQDRRDPMLTYAMTVLAANKQARVSGHRATFGRVDVHPDTTNAVPSRVTAWLDARAETEPGLESLLADVERLAAERADRDGTGVQVTPESVSAAVEFDADLARRISAADGGGQPWPVIPTMAGHDAGVLAAAGVPTGMLFVRNPTGVSHSPDEHASTADCLAGVEALARTLERLLTPLDSSAGIGRDKPHE